VVFSVSFRPGGESPQGRSADVEAEPLIHPAAVFNQSNLQPTLTIQSALTYETYF
jgi:hypothetical protein